MPPAWVRVVDIGMIKRSDDRWKVWHGLADWLLRRGTLVLIIAGPILAIVTAWVLAEHWGRWGASTTVRAVLLVDLIYAVGLVGLIAWRVASLVIARRQRSVGTKLHLRLAGVFAVIALMPTVIVAVFAALTVGVGVENMFTDRIGSVLRNSLATAEAYEREHRVELRRDILDMARDLNREAVKGINAPRLNILVGQQELVRDFDRAYVFNLDKEIVARGELSYLFNFIPPTDAQLASARQGEVVLIRDPANNEIRALVALERFIDSFLYVSRTVQGDVLQLLDQTSDTVQTYDRLEVERNDVMFSYALNYLMFAMLVVLASILMGLWFAERLARPVGRLAGAAEKVGEGDLDVRVKEERGSDEIAMLSRVFNRMTGQLKGQRDALIEARDETEKRRQFIEAVLSGVTAGVIGLDQSGRIDLINDAAADMLGVVPASCFGAHLNDVAPGLHALQAQAAMSPGATARGEVRQNVRGEHREFLARVAPKVQNAPGEGFVVTFDDLTALASAQRMAAWGDVARRIAHEIKNPLTPIQLSADRMRRKYVDKLGPDGARFEDYLDVITRQAGDIRRMVDEFSKFARMPEPALEDHDLVVLIRDALLLQREARTDIDYRTDLPDSPVLLALDRGLITQVLTNLLQNAADATDGRADRDGAAAPAPIVSVALHEGARSWRLMISDNGIGLPEGSRDRLTDPYVTTRAKGTGLGLAIVKKIVEQHGGELALGDAPGGEMDGAEVTVRLPKAAGRAAPGKTKAKTGDAA